jgi:hypothetical protein
MDVFLIPLGADRYELYCEPPAAVTDEEETPAAKGLIARLRQQFSEMLAAAEHDRNRRASGAAAAEPAADADPPQGLVARFKARSLAWVADAIAEQRLLWHLRHQEDVRLHFPADMVDADALRIARASLQRDMDRHLRWLVVDSILLILSAALILLPGPNVVGYYFAFRTVGHWLSWRGARNGLNGVRWQTRASEPLADLRQALDLAPVQRAHILSDIAARLSLDHLAAFVERLVAVRRPHAA